MSDIPKLPINPVNLNMWQSTKPWKSYGIFRQHTNWQERITWSVLSGLNISIRKRQGKGMLSHLFDTGPKPKDSIFEAWYEEDSMVMSWLWNSLSPEINDTYVSCHNQGYMGSNSTNISVGSRCCTSTRSRSRPLPPNKEAIRSLNMLIPWRVCDKS